MGAVKDPNVIDYEQIEALLTAAKPSDAYTAIVNAPFTANRAATTFLFLGVIVLLKVDEKGQFVHPVAMTQTDFVDNVEGVTDVPASVIQHPLEDTQNLIVKAIVSGSAQSTSDWYNLMRPMVTPEQAHINQASAGIAFSEVRPVQGSAFNGALIFNYFQYPQEIGASQRQFMDAYVKLVNDRLAQL